MSSNVNMINELPLGDYKWGFVTDVEEERIPKGLNEDVIRVISAKKDEPEFMLEWRLNAYRHWASLERSQAEPKWANIKYGPIDYQNIVYYSAPKQKQRSEEHTSELQSLAYLVCRLLLEKKKDKLNLTTLCDLPSHHRNDHTACRLPSATAGQSVRAARKPAPCPIHDAAPLSGPQQCANV